MTEFTYKNAKNANIGHTLFKLNYGDHLRIFYREDFDPRLKSRITKKLIFEFQKLMTIC